MPNPAIVLGLLLFSFVAADYKSEDLLKVANQRISEELLMTHPFWTQTMIPVAMCLAVVLLIVSIFAVSLIAIKALNEPEPAFATFAPPGFDALWERNVQAELGMNSSRRSSLESIKEVEEEGEEENDNTFEKKENKKAIIIPSIKFPEIPELKTKKPVINMMPLEPPKPTLASNSKSGIETNKFS